MTNNLLRCPFCGGEAGDHDHGQEYWVKCQACGFLSAQTTDRATADALWNRRAPVVERQPVALITEAPDCIKPEMRPAWVDGWNSARTAQMNTTPPELAELQATIADLTEENARNASDLVQVNAMLDDAEKEVDRLKSEIERLKGGQGEPVGRVSYIGSGFVRVRTTECLAMEQPLYASQPAPVSVATYDDGFADGLSEASLNLAAPVSVVLPERMPMPHSSDFIGCPHTYASEVDKANAHNACLDKVKELNQ
jgi:hypothetical protein